MWADLEAERITRSEAVRRLGCRYATLLRLLHAEHTEVPARCPMAHLRRGTLAAACTYAEVVTALQPGVIRPPRDRLVLFDQ